jgi:uncharacterized protein
LTLLAIIADTHLPRGARTRSVGGECRRRLAAADLILHAGDFLAASVLHDLRAVGPVHAVYGNLDEQELRETLPERRIVEVEEIRIGMVHIAGPRVGREERLARWFPECDVVVYGHTHVPQVDHHGDHWILNPGSPTERRSAPEHSMLELTVEGRRIEPELISLGRP